MKVVLNGKACETLGDCELLRRILAETLAENSVRRVWPSARSQFVSCGFRTKKSAPTVLLPVTVDPSWVVVRHGERVGNAHSIFSTLIYTNQSECLSIPIQIKRPIKSSTSTRPL